MKLHICVFTRILSLAIGLCLCLCGCGEDNEIAPDDHDGDGWNADVDCNDNDPLVHPEQEKFFVIPIEGSTSFDYNCDGEEELQWTEFSNCSETMDCPNADLGWIDYPSLPDCGEHASWAISCAGAAGCTPETVQKIQACR